MKDLGRKCCAFTKLDAGEIRRIKKSAYAKANGGRVGVCGGREGRENGIISYQGE